MLQTSHTESVQKILSNAEIDVGIRDCGAGAIMLSTNEENHVNTVNALEGAGYGVIDLDFYCNRIYSNGRTKIFFEADPASFD